MKQVYLAANPIEANVLAELLRVEGIQAIVQGEHLYAIRGVVPMSYPTVWVIEDEDYDRARELALEFDRAQRAATGQDAQVPWQCSECGEVIEGHFDQCWQCGADRPAQ